MNQVGITSRLYSSNDQRLRLLASKVRPVRADQFLCELANFPERHGPSDQISNDYLKAWDRLRNLYGDLYPSHGNPDWRVRADDAAGLVWESADEPGFLSLVDTPPKFRYAWLIPTALGREVFLMTELAFHLRGPAMFEIEQKAWQCGNEAQKLAQEAGATLEEAAMAGVEASQAKVREEIEATQRDWAITHLAIDEFALVVLRAMHVADRMHYCQNPNCPAPYYLAKRRSQRYCTDACALPAQQELKRAWWKEHGDEWRKSRKASAKKSQRKRGK